MKKLFTLLTLLLTATSMWAQGYYAPSTDEVIILNDIYDASATGTGYSKHAAVAWAGTASSSNKKPGDPNNGGAQMSSNVPCYSIKGNGGGKNITLTISGVSKVTLYHEKQSSRYPQLKMTLKDGTEQTLDGQKNVLYNEFTLDGTKSYSIHLHGTGNGSNDEDLWTYAIKLEKANLPKYDVTYYPGAGTGESFTENTTLIGDFPNTFTAPADQAFLKWNTAEDGSGDSYLPGDVATQILSLYAQYQANIARTVSNATIDHEQVSEGTKVTMKITADGFPTPSIQWYYNTVASTEGATEIENATAATYTPTLSEAGDFYFFAQATNVVSTATSEFLHVEVLPVLTQVLYTNGFDAFIKQPKEATYYKATDQEVIDGTKNVGDLKSDFANGTVSAYYMQGTDAPAIAENGTKYSTDGEYTLADNKITITKNGVSAIFDVTLEAVAPYAGTETSGDFNGEETWIKTGYKFSTESGKVGWNISKHGEEATNRRNSEGKNRIYFFLPACESVTFTNGGTERDIKVMVNGEDLSTPTSTSS